VQLFILQWVFLAAAQLAAPPEARDHTENGLALARAGNLDAAEKELRQSVKLTPHDPEVLGALGTVLALRERFDESSLYFEKALALSPADAVTRRNLARNQWKLGHFGQARVNLERVLRATPADPQATFLLGMVAESEHNHMRAAKLLASVPALVRPQPLAVAGLASAYYHTGKPDQARTTLDWLPPGASDPQSTYVAARVALEASDYETAERLLSSIRAAYPDQPALSFSLALAQYHQGHFAEGEQTLAEMAAAGQASGAAWNLMGWCVEKQGKRGEAISALSKAIDQEPSNEVNYLDLAGILATSTRRLVAALAIATRATELLPKSYKAWMLRGSIETKLQQYRDAVQSYSVAAKLRPDSPEPRRALAIAQWSNGEDTEAIRSFEQLIGRFPRDAGTYEAYGAALFKTASREDLTARAASLFQRAITLDPSLAEPHFYLGILALDRGDLQGALHELEAGVKLDGRSGRMRFALARALKRLGRSSDSEREYAAYRKLKSEEEQSESR